MAETTQMNLNVLSKTKEMVDILSRLTYRGKGDVVDLAVAELYTKITGKTPATDIAELTQSISNQ